MSYQGGGGRRTKAHLLPVAGITLAMLGLGLWLSVVSLAAPVSITVPLSDVAVNETDLDGDPGTGDWEDALTVEVPLENGAGNPYGVATLFAKHNGVNLFMRLDGFTDVPWISTEDDYFWLGIQWSPLRTSHHAGTEWDGIFFGLWNGEDYTPQPTIPPRAVDTYGFARPPEDDVVQDVVGTMRTSGGSAPFAFTAEWRKPLDSGDPDDVTFTPDGATTYNFFITTDSDGGGSSGGTLSHRQMTNLNAMKFEAAPGGSTPPTILHDPPLGVVAGESLTLTARVVDADGVAEVRVNYTDVEGQTWNETMTLDATLYVYTVPAQNESGTLRYRLWAVDAVGSTAETAAFDLPVTKLLAIPTIDAVEPAGPGCLRLTWTAPGGALSGFLVYRWNATRMAMAEVAELPAAATSYEDCGLAVDQAYTYWIVGFDDDNNQSPPSALAEGRTQPGSEAGLALDSLALILPILAVLVGVVVVVVVGRYW